MRLYSLVMSNLPHLCLLIDINTAKNIEPWLKVSLSLPSEILISRQPTSIERTLSQLQGS